MVVVVVVGGGQAILLPRPCLAAFHLTRLQPPDLKSTLSRTQGWTDMGPLALHAGSHCGVNGADLTQPHDGPPHW